MKIRTLTPNDKFEVLNLAKQFFHERIEREGIFYSQPEAAAHFDLFNHTTGLIALGIESEGRLVGVMIGIASAIIFSKELAMQILVWYVEPGSRKWSLNLLWEFERQAKQKGYGYMMTFGLTNDKTLKLFPLLKYKSIQHTFLKKLN